MITNALSAVLDRTNPMALLSEGATLAASAATMKAVTYAGTLAASRALRGSPILGSHPEAAPPRERVKVSHTSFTFTSAIVKHGHLTIPVHMLAQLSSFVTKSAADVRAVILVKRIAGTLNAINKILIDTRPRLRAADSTILRHVERIRLMLKYLLAHLRDVTLRGEPKFFDDARNMGITMMENLESCASGHIARLAALRARRRKQ